MKRVTELPMAEGESPVKCRETALECLPATNTLVPANGRSIGAFAKGSLMLDKAVKVEEIREVENYFQLALEFAKKAKCECLTVNTTARLVLDAHRKVGATLKRMQECGQLATRGREKKSFHRVTFTLNDLELNKTEARRYRLEASLPAEV